MRYNSGCNPSRPNPPIQTLKVTDALIRRYLAYRSQRVRAQDQASMSSTQWRPRLRAEKDLSSAAGDISEGSIAAPRLGSIDELDKEALREMHEKVSQALAGKGSI